LIKFLFEIFQKSDLNTKKTPGGSKTPAAIKVKAAVASPAEKSAKVNIVRKRADDGRWRESQPKISCRHECENPGNDRSRQELSLSNFA
jgi:hypothetical protein